MWSCKAHKGQRSCRLSSCLSLGLCLFVLFILPQPLTPLSLSTPHPKSLQRQFSFIPCSKSQRNPNTTSISDSQGDHLCPLQQACPPVSPASCLVSIQTTSPTTISTTKKKLTTLLTPSQWSWSVFPSVPQWLTYLALCDPGWVISIMCTMRRQD